jgi:hypothetical protein
MGITALQNPTQVVTAIGGLGTAAFGLVDASKALWGGPNHIGFGGIRTAVRSLTGVTAEPPGSPQSKILATLQANWFNGTDLNSQKAIAKSLIKLNLNATNAAAIAAATGVNGAVLTAVAGSIAAGTPLTAAQSDVYSRFDLIVTAQLDEAYQRSDQTYRNGMRALAMLAAILLAFAGGLTLGGGKLTPQDGFTCLLVGLLATPLAPIAKDLSTALATAVNTMQLVKK